MNNVVLIGRVCREINLHTANNGTQYADITIAINRRFDREKTDFINCVAFGKDAEILSKYVSKGDRLGVNGEIRTDTYTGQDGTKRSTTKVIVSAFDLLEPKKRDPGNDSNDSADDELPF